MKVVVILRLNPVLTDELELTEDESDIDREWIGLEINQFDDQSLEQAILLKESSDAHVTAIAIKDEGVERLLKTALAKGVDQALQISLEEIEDRSSRALAPMYAAAIRELQPDVVIVGVLSTDDLFGELAPYIAADLGWSQASAISDFRIEADKIIVRQEYSGGRAALLEMATPAVVGLQTATQPPRYVAGSKLRDLLKVEIPNLSIDVAPNLEKVGSTELALPDLSEGATMFEGDTDAIAEQIHSLLQEKGFAS